MARGGGRKAGGRQNRNRGFGGKTGIEEYGATEVDDVLGLNGDGDSDGGGSSDGMNQEEVFAPKGSGWGDEEEEAPRKKGKNKKKGRQEDDEDEEEDDEEGDTYREAIASGSKGWQGDDFYGGEDAAGDSSDGGSDEELNFQEAKRLEDLRAQRLGGLSVSNPLAVLLGADADKPIEEEEDDKDDKAEKELAGGAVGSSASAKFEALFEADAEKGKVQKDMSRLSLAKKKALVKKEAPELLPLLTDFQAKLASLSELQPLLKPEVLARMSKTGVEYIKAKAGLLLSTVANLAFYVLMRAEGGDVKSHPVVSQLVWLKELHDRVAPLDETLKPQVKKALKAIKKLQLAANSNGKTNLASVMATKGRPDEEEAEDAPRAKPSLSLKEKLERMKQKLPKDSAGKVQFDSNFKAPSASELLRLPGRRKKFGFASGGPADLDEIDPLLGSWMPSEDVGRQLHQLEQQTRAVRKKDRKSGADDLVEARERAPRLHVREEPMPEELLQRPKSKALDADNLEGLGPEAQKALKEAAAAKEKKQEEKSAKQAAKEQAKLLRQYRPEDEVDGRRKTSKKILANRGLVRQRKKQAGNAKVANRRKYEQRLKRRKGAVQDMREGATDGTYEGEATGVRTHLKKSMRLG